MSDFLSVDSLIAETMICSEWWGFYDTRRRGTQPARSSADYTDYADSLQNVR